jgi:hypothetical protein
MSIKIIALESLTAPRTAYLNLGEDSRLQIDQINSWGGIPSWPSKVKGALLIAYNLFMPLMVSAGLLALLLAAILCIVRRENPTLLLITAVAFWTAISCRLFIISLIDVSSFPAVNFKYLGPCVPILILTSVLSLQVLKSSFRIPEVQRLRLKLPISE